MYMGYIRKTVKLLKNGFNKVQELCMKYNPYEINKLTLQQLKHVGFLCTQTSNYTRKHRKLICFHKTFTVKDTSVPISDSIRLVSKPKANLLFVFIRTLNILHQKGFSSSNRLYSVVKNSIADSIDFCKKKVLSIPHINEWAFRTIIVNI